MMKRGEKKPGLKEAWEGNRVQGLSCFTVSPTAVLLAKYPSIKKATGMR